MEVELDQAVIEVVPGNIAVDVGVMTGAAKPTMWTSAWLYAEPGQRLPLESMVRSA